MVRKISRVGGGAAGSAASGRRRIPQTARQVPPDKPATIDQRTEGALRFRDLINVVGGDGPSRVDPRHRTIEKQAEESVCGSDGGRDV